MLPAGMPLPSRLRWSDSGSANVPNLKTKPSILDAPAFRWSLMPYHDLFLEPLPFVSSPPFSSGLILPMSAMTLRLRRCRRWVSPPRTLTMILKHLRSVTPDQPRRWPLATPAFRLPTPAFQAPSRICL